MIIPGDIASLIDFFGFTISLFYCAAMVALIVMRFTKKDEHRPIKVSCLISNFVDKCLLLIIYVVIQVPIIIPIIVMAVSAVLIVAPIAAAPQVQYFYALLFILAGLIFYVPFVYYKRTVPGIGKNTLLSILLRCLSHYLLTINDFCLSRVIYCVSSENSKSSSNYLIGNGKHPIPDAN